MIQISVLASQRKVANVQFITTALNLQRDVQKWCLSQGRRNDNYGLTRLYQTAESVSVAVITLNSIYANTIEGVKQRLNLMREAEQNLHVFNAQLTAMYPLFNIKHKRAKRWSDWSNTESKLLAGVRRADMKRLNKLQEANQ